MVRLAREVNEEAVAAGRLEVVQASADDLPFEDDRFTAAAMTGVLGFLPDSVAALREIRRTLAPGGRLAVLGSDPELRGTPGAPEPMASRLRFYDTEELRRLGGRTQASTRSASTYVRSGARPRRQGSRKSTWSCSSSGPGTRFLFARKGS